MKIQFLGTAACDYSPLLATTFKDCFDKNARRSSAILINDRVLVDCGHFILDEIRIAGVDCKKIECVFVTHSHADHFSEANLAAIAANADHSIGVYGNQVVVDRITNFKANNPASAGAQLLCPHLAKEIPLPSVINAGGLNVTPLRSNHETETPGEHTLHYIFAEGETELFYGLDGAWYPTPTGKYLYNRKVKAFVFDTTCGDYEDDYRIFEHNTIPMIRELYRVMKNHGVFADDCKRIMSHLAPSLHKPHDETQEIVAKDGFIVAYDGMILEI